MLGHFLGLVVLLTIGFADGQQRQSIQPNDDCNSNDLCIGKTDPLEYYVYPKDPSKYFACYQIELPDGSITPLNMGCQQCARRSTVYSPECKRCLSPKDVASKNCSDPVSPPAQQSNSSAPVNVTSCAPIDFCVSKPNATFRNPADNSMFFSCVNEVATECQKCAGSLIYVEVCGSCEVNDTQLASECPVTPTMTAPEHLCPDDFCITKDDGDHEVSSNSSTYHTCMEGTCMVRSCPLGTAFAGICDKKCVVNYTNVKSECPTLQPVDSPVVIKTCPANFCSLKQNRNYPVASGVKAQNYYACTFSLCNVFTCQTGLVYRADKDWCDSPDNF